MLEFLIRTDTELFLFLNGIHSSFWDTLMYYISSKTIWIPLYLTVVFFIFRKYKLKKGLVILVFFALLITMSDQISVHLFKNVFERLRPCHNPQIQHLVHTLDHCGGQYGFVSSHASNSFAFAVFSLMLFRDNRYSLSIIFWAFLVSYSRVYLGVHYPGDIISGAILGALIAVFLYKIYQLMFKNIKALNKW